MKVYLLLLFLTALNFKEIHSWCTECPDRTNLLANITCSSCKDAYFDKNTLKCVDFLQCSVFDKMTPTETLKFLISSSLDAAIACLSTSTATEITVSKGIQLILTIITEFVTSLKADPLFKSFVVNDFSTISVDLKVVIDLVKKRLDGLQKKITSHVKHNLAPAGFTNKRIIATYSKQCHASALCITKKLMQKYKERIVNVTGLIFSESLQEFVECLNDIGIYADDNCADKTCPLIKYIWVFRVDILNTLSRLIPHVVETAKSFVLLLTSLQTELLLTKVFNILVKKIFSGGTFELINIFETHLEIE